MNDLLTPKQVAISLGVSESSLKRWCDQGKIDSERTPGGHRRIRINNLIRFLRDQDKPLANPESIGLPKHVGMATRSVEGSVDALLHAASESDYELCRRLVLDLYLGGNSVAELCQNLVAPALHAIGDSWECGELEIYEEHRTCEIFSRLLHELRAVLPEPAADGPSAFGGSISGDQYRLPTYMVELILVEKGFRAQSLGQSVPIDSLMTAVKDQRPGVVWVSVSHAPDRDALHTDLKSFCGEVSASTRVLIGGREADPSIVEGAPNAVYCEDFDAIGDAVADLV